MQLVSPLALPEFLESQNGKTFKSWRIILNVEEEGEIYSYITFKNRSEYALSNRFYKRGKFECGS